MICFCGISIAGPDVVVSYPHSDSYVSKPLLFVYILSHFRPISIVEAGRVIGLLLNPDYVRNLGFIRYKSIQILR